MLPWGSWGQLAPKQELWKKTGSRTQLSCNLVSSSGRVTPGWGYCWRNGFILLQRTWVVPWGHRQKPLCGRLQDLQQLPPRGSIGRTVDPTALSLVHPGPSQIISGEECDLKERQRGWRLLAMPVEKRGFLTFAPQVCGAILTASSCCWI